MTEAPTTLYRLYDRDGTLLYVGISRQWAKRAKRHAGSQRWWRQVKAVTLEEYPSQEAAAAAEAEAIAAEDPRYNRQLRRAPVPRHEHVFITATTSDPSPYWCRNPRCRNWDRYVLS